MKLLSGIADRLPSIGFLSIVLIMLSAVAGSTEKYIWVSIVKPSPDEFVIGRIMVEAQVVSTRGVREVEFYVDGRAVGLLVSPPYGVEVDLGDQNIAHQITVIARDIEGAHATHSIVTQPVPIARDYDVELQQLYVTAAIGEHRVLDLEVDDFVVRDDNRVQRITTFAKGDIPFTAALMIDASASMQNERLASATAGAAAFVRRLQPLDHAKLLVYSHQLLNTTPFTNNRDLLRTALSGAEARGGTALNDHLFLALRLLQQRQGRRVLVLLSDGVDIHSVLSMDQVSEQAKRSQVMIFWIRLTDQAGGVQPDQPGIKMWSAWRNPDEFRDQYVLLQEIVEESGGRIIDVDRIGQIEGVFVQILQELREQYVLGYYPTNRQDDGSWHRVGVSVDRPGVEVRTHSGYIDY